MARTRGYQGLFWPKQLQMFSSWWTSLGVCTIEEWISHQLPYSATLPTWTMCNVWVAIRDYPTLSICFWEQTWAVRFGTNHPHKMHLGQPSPDIWSPFLLTFSTPCANMSPMTPNAVACRNETTRKCFFRMLSYRLNVLTIALLIMSRLFLPRGNILTLSVR